MDDVRTGYPYELGAKDPFALPPPVLPDCPLCSGTVSRGDPAAQALEWGVRVAEATPGASNFWKAALVHEIASQAASASEESDTLQKHIRLWWLLGAGGEERFAPCGTPTQWSADRQFDDGLDRGQLTEEHWWRKTAALASWDPLTPGPPPEDDPQRREKEEAFETAMPGDDLGFPVPDPGKGLPPPVAVDGRCCVEKFLFPKGDVRTGPVKQGERTPPKDMPEGVTFVKLSKISIEYDVESVYQESASATADAGAAEGSSSEGSREGEGAVKIEACRCACCQFRQYITSNYVIDVDAVSYRKVGDDPTKYVTGSTVLRDGSGMDCFWQVQDAAGKKRNVTGSQHAPDPDVMRAGETIAAGPFCVGERATPTGTFPRDDGKGKDVRGDYSGENGCRYTWVDTPEQNVPINTLVEWHWSILGIIHDVCKNNVVRSRRRLDHVLRGSVQVGPGGKEYFKESPATE